MKKITLAFESGLNSKITSHYKTKNTNNNKNSFDLAGEAANLVTLSALRCCVFERRSPERAVETSILGMFEFTVSSIVQENQIHTTLRCFGVFYGVRVLQTIPKTFARSWSSRLISWGVLQSMRSLGAWVFDFHQFLFLLFNDFKRFTLTCALPISLLTGFSI